MGRKRWLLIPPEAFEEGGNATAIMLREKWTDIDPLVWFNDVYPQLEALGIPYVEVMQEAGDMVYVPAGGWYHQVVSLTDTASVVMSVADLQ